MRLRKWSATQSSESRQNSQRPRAAATATLRAAEAPWRGPTSNRTRGSRAACSSTMRAVPSLEPSSTTSTSKSERGWRARQASVSARVACALRAGTTIETSGGSAMVGARTQATHPQIGAQQLDRAEQVAAELDQRHRERVFVLSSQLVQHAAQQLPGAPGRQLTEQARERAHVRVAQQGVQVVRDVALAVVEDLAAQRPRRVAVAVPNDRRGLVDERVARLEDLVEFARRKPRTNSSFSVEG